MDINQFFRVAESNGLDAINLIKNSKASAIPQYQDIENRYNLSASDQAYVAPRSFASISTVPMVTPTKVELYPKQLYPTQLYTPMKSGVSIQITEPTLSQINKVYPAKLTSDTKLFELPDISKFPKISEMIFGEPAARFNRWVPQISMDIENNYLEKTKTDLELKLQNENIKGQGDSIQAKKLKTDLIMIEDAINSDNYFVKRAVTFQLGQQYVFGSAGAGLVGLGKNLWTTAKSVYEQFALSEEEKNRVQQQNQVVEDSITKFLDNVIADLRPSEKGPFTQSNVKYVFNLAESVGAMVGIMYASGLTKSPYVATLIGTTLESLSEGGATYQENRQKGMSVNEAFNRQASVIGMNFVLNYLTNRYTKIFEGVSEKELKNIFKKALNVLGSSLGEGIQEAGQQVISNLATNRPFDEGVFEAFGFGTVFGAGFRTIEFVHQPTGEVIYKKEIQPNYAKELAENSLSVINGVGGTNVNLNSSMEEITKAYYQAVSTAANIADASGLYLKLDGAYQTINSYKNALGQVKNASLIDPKGVLNNRQFAKEKTKKNLQQKEKVRGVEKNALKRKYNELKSWYDAWVNNVEVPGKAFQLIDENTKLRLGRELKPGESVDMAYDLMYQLSNIIETSPEYREISSIAKDLKANNLSVDEFGQYLESRRNLALAEANVKKGINVEEEMRTVAGFEPIYGKYAARYYSAINSIAKMIWENGLITTEEYISITKNKDYTPFYKIFPEGNEPIYNELLKQKTVGLGKQTVVKKIESSNVHEVENPFLMSIPYIAHAYKQVQRNKVGLALINSMETGDYQKAGFQGYIVQTAEDGRLRKLIKDLKPEIENIVSKATKFLAKKKKSARELQREIIKMVQESYKIVSLSDTELVDTTTQNRLTRKVETQLNKREELMQDAEDIFQGILEVKQTGEQVLNDQKYLDKTNRMLETRNEWVQDLVDLGADMLGKRKKSQMRDKNGKLMSLKDRRNFIKSASQRDIFNYILDLYDLPLPEFKRLLGKAITKNLKIKSVLQEIENIKNDRVTNIVVNNLIKLPSAEVDALYKKYGKTQKAIGKVITELKRLTDARIINSAVNSLIKQTPEELTKIKKKIEKKYPIMDQLIQDILDTQAKIDEESGYLKKLNEIEDELNTAKTAGLETVEAYKDGYVIKAVVDKTIAESMKVTNNPESVKNLMKFLNFVGSWVKIGAVVVNPALAPKLFLYDQQAAALFSKDPFKTSALNVPTFANALITTMTSGPFASKIYSILPERFQRGIKAWEEFQQAGGASSELYVGSKQRSEEWLRSGGKNKVSIGGIVNFFGKTDQITRFQIFLVNKQNYLNQGFTEEEASTKAAYDARNTLPNFYRRSNTLKVLDAFMPFIAAAVQSGAKLRENITKNPERTVDRLMWVAAYYALSMLWNLSSEERRKAWAGIPEWMKRNNVIILFEEKDENNNPYYATIPVEQSTMNTLQGVRKSVEGLASADGPVFLSGMSDVMEGIYGIRIPTNEQEANQQLARLNPLIRLPFELNANYNYFNSRKIVPPALEGRPAYLQYDEKSSEFAKAFGRMFVDSKNKKWGISPKKIDHVLDSFGQIGDSVRESFKKIVKGTATEEDKKLVNKYEGTLKGLFYKNIYGAEEQKIWEDKAQFDLQKAELNFNITEALNSGDFQKAKELANNNVTKEQWKGIENAYQENKLKETLSGKERAYFNMPTSYLQTIKQSKPEDSAVIDKVLELKKTVSKLPNMDTGGISFKPGTSTGGLATVKSTGIKLGKIAKPKKVKLKAAKAPKKIKVAKPKQVKQVRLAKIKPLKKIRRV